MPFAPILKCFMLGFLLLAYTLPHAQVKSMQINGKVLNQQEEAIASATVTLHNSQAKLLISTATDSLGQFLIAYDKAGKYTLQIQSIGYQPYKLAAFEMANLDLGVIQLSAAEKTLQEITVSGKKKTFSVEGGSIIYHVENALGAQDVSVLEALKRAPGVQVDNESDISLNGQHAVQVLIDGRSTSLSGKELVDLLKSLSANNLKSIEIINSPTAKYDAAGAAGIIHIKTKKNQITGLNGQISSSIAYGVSPKQLQNINLSYRVNKLNIYGSYNHTLGNYNYTYGMDREQSGKQYTSHTDDVDKRQKMASQLGMDYYLNDKHTLGFVANGNFIFGGGITETHTDISNIPSAGILETLDAVNDYVGQNTARYNFNLNYKFEDSLGHSLNIDVDYGNFDKWNKNLQSNIYRDKQAQILQENYNRTRNGIGIDLMGIKLDYGMNLWQGKLETGLKYSNVASENDFRFYQQLASGDSLDNRRSNDFQFDESTYSAYVDYKRKIGTWDVQGGLRVERANSTGTLFYIEDGADRNQDIKRAHTHLFPFLSGSRKLGENQNIALSYTKRIDRPAYQDLNPFVYMLDELSFWQGNPFLSPSLTHRLTLLYSFKHATILSFNFAYTDQLMAKVTDTLEMDKIVMISKNLGTQKHWSLALTQNLSPKPWWNITFNGLLYYIQNDISFDAYRNLNLQQLAGRANLTQSFQLPYKLKTEIAATYNSKRLSGANTLSQPTSQVDIALQKSLLKDRATLRLAVNDIYKGNQSKYTQNFPGFSSSSYGYYESRQVRLSFSYKFSSGSTKAQRNRKSALESESGRIQ